MQSPRRRRKKRARRDEVIVASNGCRCGDCLECRLAKLRRLGETHRKGGRGPHHWNGMAPILLPMVIAGLGIVFSIIGTFFVRIKGETSSVMNALNLGNWSSMLLVAISSYFLVDWMLPESSVARAWTTDVPDPVTTPV